MSEKINDNVKDLKKENSASSADTAAEKVEFEQFDAFEWQRERDESGFGGTSEGIETVYSVPLGMQRYAGVPSADGKTYDRYGVAFKTKRGGVDIPMKFYVVPPQQTSEMYNLARFAFGDAEKKPLEIVKTVSVQTRNNRSVENIRYGMRVSTVDDYGSTISCNFNPQSAGDRAMFQNLINVLKARNIIK